LRDTCVVRRSTTNTPLQALAVMNEPAFLEASRMMAARVVSAGVSDKERLSFAFELALGRSPTTKEVSLFSKSLDRYRKTYLADFDAAGKLLRVGDSPLSRNIPAYEYAAWMIVCSSIMNTDEFLTMH
jgi:hypothetical protein